MCSENNDRKFEKIEINGSHEFEKIKNKESYLIALDWAIETAKLKLDNTVDTWQKDRHPNAKIIDILSGDLAKNIVKLYINCNIDINVIEYDAIRTDDFLNRDEFDLKINKNEIEVKSSLEKYSRDIDVICNKRNIIINLHRSHMSSSKYVFQVFFVPKNLGDFKEIETLNKQPNKVFSLSLFMQHTKLFYLAKMDIYICGWVDQTLLSYGDSFGVRNTTTGANYRKYYKSLINDSNSPSEFLDEDF